MDKQITIRMPKETLAKWLAALRSGECRQAKHYLRAADGYCCLGVLQVCVDGSVETDRDGEPLSLPTLEWLESNGISFLGGEGVTDTPYLPPLQARAEEANDGYGVEQRSFAEIADAIEDCAEGV